MQSMYLPNPQVVSPEAELKVIIYLKISQDGILGFLFTCVVDNGEIFDTFFEKFSLFSKIIPIYISKIEVTHKKCVCRFFQLVASGLERKRLTEYLK